MQATIRENIEPKFNPSHRREKNFVEAYSLLYVDADTNEIKQAADVRIYATAARTYCCVWIHANGTHTSGSAFASGYGYHRASAAVHGALNNAGFRFTEHFAGAGENKIREALEAVGEVLVSSKKTVLSSLCIHKTHA